MVRERAGIQISVAKKARSWDFCREKVVVIDWRHFESSSSFTDAAEIIKIFGRRSIAFVLQTRFAHHISIPQLSVLVQPMTRTLINIEVDKIMTEIKTGAKSLHRRSIRRVTALRWVRLYDFASSSSSFAVLGSQDVAARVVVAARVGTHSLSMAIIFPIPLRFSHIPRTIINAKIHGAFIPPFGYLLSLLLLGGADVSLFIKPGRRSAVIVPVDEENRMGPGTRKIHPRHAKSTEARFADMVMRRVRNRDGALSIHLPTTEDRHSAAKVVHKPLDDQLVGTSPHVIEGWVDFKNLELWTGDSVGADLPHRLGKQRVWKGRSRK